MEQTTARPRPLTRAQWVIISIAGVFFAGLAILGGYGSFAAVEQVAARFGFGDHAWIVPIGVDLGILALLLADLVLEQLDMALPPLRWLAWAFTAATIWFNIAAVPNDLPMAERITGQGMHAAMPILFVAWMDGIRHAIRRRTGMVSGRRMDTIRLSRWLLDPFGTFALWRRMVLWEVRSYRVGLIMESHRRKVRGDLRKEFGRAWRRKAPADRLWPLSGGMLDLALRLTEGTTGTTAGDHPATGTPQQGTTEETTGARPHAPEVTGGDRAALIPAATSTETGPRPALTAPARTTRPGTVTAYVDPEGTTSTPEAETTETTEGTTTGTNPESADWHHGTTGQWSPMNEGHRTDAGTTHRQREHRAAPARPGVDADKLAEARELARGIVRAGGAKVSRRSLKAAGMTGKTELLQALADLMNEEIESGALFDSEAETA